MNRPLGDFLRSRRTNIKPDERSGSNRQRRRTAGLKREEVAERAGISTEWYVKIEQGRAGNPSAETIEALGKALLLNESEMAHLCSLASARTRKPFIREWVPDKLREIVMSLAEPAYLTGQRFDVLAWNEAAAALFPDLLTMNDEDRNVLFWMLTKPAARELFGSSWENEARRIVSLFRASYDLWPDDPAFAELLNRVRTQSDAFDAWWSEHEVGAPLFGNKDLYHPQFGIVRYAYASFQSNDDPALKLSIYTRC